ncbi:MAG: cob(I)yrinic acid a,c-diamide adenosyltransferase [Candidatus Wildermuthbacteria bacterium]|nr:cob(I)yrinic acid a,c-diamide adenosyltransferase [Candidatus Wildermuthbacteria bacterium]
MARVFYTGKGDKGVSYFGSKKIEKDSPEVETVGALDELNSLLGIVKNQKIPTSSKKILEEIQQDLFIIQAHIGCLLTGWNPPEFKEEKIRKLEEMIDTLEQKVKPERKFVVYGQDEISAWLDFARAVARRAELKFFILNKKLASKKKKLPPELGAYLNRLSSFLYAMARFSTKTNKKKEKHPSYR